MDVGVDVEAPAEGKAKWRRGSERVRAAVEKGWRSGGSAAKPAIARSVKLQLYLKTDELTPEPEETGEGW